MTNRAMLCSALTAGIWNRWVDPEMASRGHADDARAAVDAAYWFAGTLEVDAVGVLAMHIHAEHAEAPDGETQQIYWRLVASAAHAGLYDALEERAIKEARRT